MNTITIQIKSVYGNETVYPVCDKAKAFAEIAGTKTLTPQALRVIERMGYQIKVQQQCGLSLQLQAA